MKEFYVAGVSFRADDVEAILEKYYKNRSLSNDSYFTSNRPQQYSKYPIFITSSVELLAEPDNEYDKDAIQVLIDDVVVGYVPKEKTAEIHPQLSDENIYQAVIEADIKHRFEIEITMLKSK